MSIAVLFTIAKSEKHTKCPSVNRWMDGWVGGWKDG
jgi:hypothetical protein